jgi:multidrug resistance efflux pump
VRPEEFGLSVEVEVITPEQAAEYLKNNAYHRKVKKKKVAEYMKEMVDGNWKLNGKTIVFDRDGRLLNGQHRLGAVAEAGVSLTTLVVRGVDPEVLETNPENNAIIEE